MVGRSECRMLGDGGRDESGDDSGDEGADPGGESEGASYVVSSIAGFDAVGPRRASTSLARSFAISRSVAVRMRAAKLNVADGAAANTSVPAQGSSLPERSWHAVLAVE